MKQQLQVVMLPTKEIPKYEETNYASGYVEHKGKLYLEGTLVNLFLVSDEKPKQNDWVIAEIAERGLNVYKHQGRPCSITPLKKIIVSTDTSLNLPQIPQDFIKYFVEKQGNVGKVCIEYSDTPYDNNGNVIGTNNISKLNIQHTFKPKLNKNNEVIISLEEKNYTRDEMITFGQKCGTAGTMAERIGEDFNHLFLQLVEQNL